MPEIIPALVGCVEVTDGADSFPQFLDGAGADASEMSFELGESHFDGVEVGTVGRQEKEPGATVLEDGLGLFALMAGQVVEDDDIARPQGRGELCLDVGFEERPVHRALDDPRGGQPVAAYPSGE